MPAKHAEIYASAQQLALAFGASHDAVQRRLKAAGLKPVLRGKSKVFPLSLCVRHLIDLVPGAEINPDLLPPHAMKAFWQGREARLRARQRNGELIENTIAHDAVTGLFKIFAAWADTAPDVLERDAGIDGRMAQHVERHIDGMRDGLASHIEAFVAAHPIRTALEPATPEQTDGR